MMHLFLLTFILLAVSLPLGICGQTLSIQLNVPDDVIVNVASKSGWGYRIEQSSDWEDWAGASDHLTESKSFILSPQSGQKLFYRLVLWELPEDPLKIVVIGDSTTADFSHYGGSVGGWGEGLGSYFSPDVRIGIFALPGQSSKTYLESEWQINNLLNVSPEFVFIQFGMIDELSGQAEKRTSIEEYESHLAEIVSLVRQFGGTPILITPITLRKYDANGQVVPYLDDRSDAMLRVAGRVQCPSIDLNRLTKALYNDLGETGSAHLTINDRLHLLAPGAEMIAGLVVEHLPAFLVPYLSKEAVDP